MKGYSILGGKVIHADFSALQKKAPPLPKAHEVSPEVEAVFAQRPQETIIPPPQCKCWDCTTGPMQVEEKRYPGLGLFFALLTGLLAWSMLVYFFAKVLL